MSYEQKFSNEFRNTTGYFYLKPLPSGEGFSEGAATMFIFFLTLLYITAIPIMRPSPMNEFIGRHTKRADEP